jgi:hypothetical protein
MSNLLKPFGVPSKAWTKRRPKQFPQSKQGPCQILGHISGELVYDEQGAMPNDVGSWISTTKGIRRLQYEELAKAKGMDDLLLACERSHTRSSIRQSKGIHVWTAALEALGVWMRGPEEEVPKNILEEASREIPSWNNEGEDRKES